MPRSLRSIALGAAPIALLAAGTVAGDGCTHRDAAKDAAVDACVVALRASEAEPDPERAMRNIALACAQIYDEPACRDAYVRAVDDATDPSERARVLFDGCGAAYCPKLPEPKPALCTAPADLPTARAAQWAEFQRIVLTRDLGAPRAERVIGAMHAASDARRRAPRAAASR